MTIATTLSSIPSPVKWVVGTVLAVTLLVFLWLFATKGINGVEDFVFWKQAAAQKKEVDRKLAAIEPMQKAFDKTLVELAKSKEALAAAAKESDIRMEIAKNDALSAKQKVKAFEDTLSAAPTVTDPSGATMDDLCARAKASGGSSPQVIAALCPAG